VVCSTNYGEKPYRFYVYVVSFCLAFVGISNSMAFSSIGHDYQFHSQLVLPGLQLLMMNKKENNMEGKEKAPSLKSLLLDPYILITAGT